MKKQIICLSLCTMTGLLLIHAGATDVFAGEGADNWRPTYDLVMKWVNFLILASIVVRFGKAPLMNFLRLQKENLAQEISDLEKEKAQMAGEIEKTHQALKESDANFAKLKERIVRQGEKKKQEIIEEARKQGGYMLEVARQKVESQLATAQRVFKEELVDAAISLAMKQLPAQMTDADNDNLIATYLETASAK
ncbi:hypothetical protein DENIS_4168 [Desulfonema ishimotonii]|uniref:ATP synthase subunit b n=1 Tax=Desulfonema ishimotonii TaxID=45657 RepID=A0A401G1V2_9BACT|nr:ATP synthase F0 subunit B [Desulfonema ishimotonii]GBC63175.1 hypothetical protein DENIS_4168 [Desulfonema ishimotonii]